MENQPTQKAEEESLSPNAGARFKQAITEEGSDLNTPSLAEALTRHATRKRQTVDLLTLVFTKLLICCRFLKVSFQGMQGISLGFA